MSWGYAKQKLLGISVIEPRNSQDSQDCAFFRAELVGVSIIWGFAMRTVHRSFRMEGCPLQKFLEFSGFELFCANIPITYRILGFPRKNPLFMSTRCGNCQGAMRLHLVHWSSACGWPIWLKGQSAKGICVHCFQAYICRACSPPLTPLRTRPPL